MKSESEETWVSKKPKVVESVDKQARTGNMDSPVISNEAVVKSSCNPHSCVHVKSSVMDRAERIRANLSHGFPSFVKRVGKSHVFGRFCLNLPGLIWKELPKHDSTVVLMDENGKAYQTNFRVRKHTLDGGWRAFSMAHKLLEGDALVFHMIAFCKFKAITEAKREKLAQLDEEIDALKASVLKVRESMNSLEAEAEALEVKNEKLGIEFMELAGAT